MGKTENGRDRLLGAAQSLFHTQGVAATSVDDIAKAAGVGKATFYHHFASKEELVATIAQNLATFYEERVIPTTARPDMALEAAWRTLAFSERYLRSQGCTKGCPIGNLASELADTDGVLRERLATLIRHWEAALAQPMARASADGSLPARVDHRAMATLILAAYQGATLLARTTKDIAFYERTATAIRQLLSDGAPPVPQPRSEPVAEPAPPPAPPAPERPLAPLDPRDAPWLV